MFFVFCFKLRTQHKVFCVQYGKQKRGIVWYQNHNNFKIKILLGRTKTFSNAEFKATLKGSRPRTGYWITTIFFDSWQHCLITSEYLTNDVLPAFISLRFRQIHSDTSQSYTCAHLYFRSLKHLSEIKFDQFDYGKEQNDSSGHWNKQKIKLEISQ